MDGAVSGEQPQQPPKTYGEVFDEAFPHYLAMGMPSREYWEDDCELVRAYRKAHMLKQEADNQFAWLQGMYVYEAICDVAPVLHAFAKRGTTVRPYPDKPYEFKAPKRLTKAQENEQKMRNGIAWMERMTARFNQNFNQRMAAQKAAEEKAKAGEADGTATETTNETAEKPIQETQAGGTE